MIHYKEFVKQNPQHKSHKNARNKRQVPFLIANPFQQILFSRFLYHRFLYPFKQIPLWWSLYVDPLMSNPLNSLRKSQKKGPTGPFNQTST